MSKKKKKKNSRKYTPGTQKKVKQTREKKGLQGNAAAESEETAETLGTEETREAWEGSQPQEDLVEGTEIVFEDLNMASPEPEIPVENMVKKLPWWWIAAAAAVCLIGVLGIWWYGRYQVYTGCSVEAGIAVNVEDFLRKSDPKAYFTEASDPVDITVPGEYHLEIQKGWFTYSSVLKITDTISPQVETQSVKLELGKTCEPEDFIKSIQDATATEVSFVQEPDYTEMEPQQVEIAVVDAGDNQTIVQAELSILSVVETLDWEVGSKAPEITDFVLHGDGGKIVTDLTDIDWNAVASYEVEVELNEEIYEVNLRLVDTVAPTLQVKNVEGSTNCKRKADEFVADSSDVTAVTFSFQEAPDTKKTGTQTVVIIAEDEGGNQTKKEAQLTLAEDTEAPVILGAEDWVVYIGETVSYKANIRVEDICPEAANVTVDSSKVNLNAAGSYPVTYTAKDCSGNTTSVTVTLTVKERSYSLEDVNQLADRVLSRILTDGMSTYEKAYAIFKYTKGSISYISSSEKGNYLRSAYEGLVLKKGDCYVYASTAKVLLNRAGITNMDIERIPSGTTMHYWNLVDIGDGHGWYHFDTTPRKDGPVIFLWNDAQMKDYSDRHNNSHNYDRAVYPVIN